MAIVLGYDVTGSNYNSVPAGQRAGYDTGSAGIAWSAAMWADNPGAVHIDQAPGTAGDVTADVLDVENGAVPVGSAEIAAWVKAAQAAFSAARRPGQRRPCLYQSASNVTANVNALTAAGITSGVSLWIAHFGISEANAAAVVAAASGPFPVTGFQFTDLGGGGAYDLDIFSQAWLAAQSGAAGDTVAQGSSGPAVLALQKRLSAWDKSVAADGLFGVATLAAVKAFQGEKKLAVDGIAGPVTWKLLDSSPAVTPPPAAPLPAPPDLRQQVASTAAAGTFTWGAVAGVRSYRLQLEWYKDQFGWVLSADTSGISGLSHDVVLAARTRYRWRVAADAASYTWSPWSEFATS